MIKRLFIFGIILGALISIRQQPVYAQIGSVAYPCDTQPFSLRHSDSDRYILTGLLKTSGDIQAVEKKDIFYDKDLREFYVKYSFIKAKATDEVIQANQNHAIFNEFILSEGLKNMHVFFADDNDQTVTYISCTPTKRVDE